MIRAVLFDIDDTLFEFDPLKARAAFTLGARRTWEFLKSRELEVPSFEKFLKTHCSIARRMKWIARLSGQEQSIRHVLRRLCIKLRLQRDEVSLSRLGWHWYEPLVEAVTVAPDVIPTLIELRDAGVKLGIICNTPLQGEVIDKHLEIEGLIDFFPVRIYSSDVGYRKPDRRIFTVALKELDVRGPEAIYVGDRPKPDVNGAHRANMLAVLKQKPGAAACESADFCVTRVGEILSLPPVKTALMPGVRQRMSA
jgi:HAD superfamily hydrolase (TIGR01549 family)